MYDILIQLGLSDKEAKIYLAALKLGSATAARIAQAAELNRPITYVILEKLSKMGLVTIFDKDKVQFFSAADPEQLFRMAEEEKNKLEKKVTELKDRLPEFKALFARADRPRVLLFESSESAGDYFFKRLKNGEKIYAFTNLDLLARRGGDTTEPTLRLKKNISTHVLYTRSDGPVSNATNQQELREAKYVSQDEFPFESIITCAPESGVIFLEDPVTTTQVVIENKQLAKSLQAVFMLLWAKI